MDKKEKIIKAVLVIAGSIFGFWILSIGFRIIWEAIKSMYQNW